MKRHINKSQSALLVGGGYVASYLAPRLIQSGYDVMVTSRNGQTEIKDVHCLKFDGDASPELKYSFLSADLILSSIPPNKKSGHDPVIRAFKHLTPSANWIGYLSATSVYGNRNGQWAFEGEPPTPSLKRGRLRAEAEIAWIETLWPVHIFRLSGIYGPSRSPFKKLRKSEARAVIKADHVVNRIHVDDIIRALALSIDKPNPLAIYNLSDGNPAPPQDVLDYAAELIGQTKAKRIDINAQGLSEMARSFYLETKRINIDRAKTELDWSPIYPDYKTGLKAVLSSET